MTIYKHIHSYRIPYDFVELICALCSCVGDAFFCFLIFVEKNHHFLRFFLSECTEPKKKGMNISIFFHHVYIIHYTHQRMQSTINFHVTVIANKASQMMDENFSL